MFLTSQIFSEQQNGLMDERLHLEKSVSVIKNLSQSPLKSVGITGLCSHFSYLVKREWVLIIRKERNDIVCLYGTKFLSPTARKRKAVLVEESVIAHIDGCVCDSTGLQASTATTRWQTPLGSLDRLLRSAGKGYLVVVHQYYWQREENLSKWGN